MEMPLEPAVRNANHSHAWQQVGNIPQCSDDCPACMMQKSVARLLVLHEKMKFQTIGYGAAEEELKSILFGERGL